MQFAFCGLFHYSSLFIFYFHFTCSTTLLIPDPFGGTAGLSPPSVASAGLADRPSVLLFHPPNPRPKAGPIDCRVYILPPSASLRHSFAAVQCAGVIYGQPTIYDSLCIRSSYLFEHTMRIDVSVFKQVVFDKLPDEEFRMILLQNIVDIRPASILRGDVDCLTMNQSTRAFGSRIRRSSCSITDSTFRRYSPSVSYRSRYSCSSFHAFDAREPSQLAALLSCTTHASSALFKYHQPMPF